MSLVIVSLRYCGVNLDLTLILSPGIPTLGIQGLVINGIETQKQNFFEGSLNGLISSLYKQKYINICTHTVHKTYILVYMYSYIQYVYSTYTRMYCTSMCRYSKFTYTGTGYILGCSMRSVTGRAGGHSNP